MSQEDLTTPSAVLRGLAKMTGTKSLSLPQPQSPHQHAVCTLPTPELAPSIFVCRKNLLEKVHTAILQNEEENDWLKKMVVLKGPHGIGKSWLAKKYAQIYANYHQNNVWWISAECESSLENCFLSLARHFKIPQMTLDHTVVNVYRHFSTHVKKGLFIFDGLEGGKEAANFELEKFLPIETLENTPHFLLVTTNTNILNPNFPTTTTTIIEMSYWTTGESVEYLKRALNLEKIQNETDDPSSLENALQEFGELFGGFPLALNLISASISLDLDPLACFDEHAKEVEHKIRANIQEFRSMSSISQDDLLLEAGGSIQNYENLAKQIWHRILNRMRRRPDTNSKMAVQLFNIMAFLPSQRIGVEFCHSIYNFLENNLAPNYLNLKNDPLQIPIQKTEVWQILQMLEKVGLVTIFEQDYWGFDDDHHWIGCHHPLIQKWTRQNLKDYQQTFQNSDNNDPSSDEDCQGSNFYLTMLANFLESFCLDSIQPMYYNEIVHHLMEADWPDKTYCLRLCAILKKNSFNFHHLDRKKGDLIEILNLFKKNMKKSFQQEDNKDFFDWFKHTIVYYQDVKPYTDLDGSGKTLVGSEILNPVPFFTQANVDKDEIFCGKKMTLLEFLEWTLHQVARYPDNYQIHLVALDVVGDLWNVLVNNEKFSIKIINWVHAFLNSVQQGGHTPAKIGGEEIRKFLKIVHEAGFIPLENLMKLSFATVEARVGRQDDENLEGFECWQFFWNTLKCVEDWPHGIWIEAACSNMAVQSFENGHSVSRLFLSSGGLDILTKLLRTQNSAAKMMTPNKMAHRTIEGMNLVIERMVSLLYFDEFVTVLLGHEDFKAAFENSAAAAHDVVVNASKYILKCRTMGTLDRMLVTFFAIFVKDRARRSKLWVNAFNLRDMECCHLMYDKVSQFLLTLGISERRVVVDFLWFKWESRMVILDSFLESSRRNPSGPVSRAHSSLNGLAVKLQQFSSLLQ